MNNNVIMNKKQQIYIENKTWKQLKKIIKYYILLSPKIYFYIVK